MPDDGRKFLIEPAEIDGRVVVLKRQVVDGVPVTFSLLGIVPELLPMLDFTAITAVVALDEPVENIRAVRGDVVNDEIRIGRAVLLLLPNSYLRQRRG